MKRITVLFLFSVLSILSYAQPTYLRWDKSIGGTGTEIPAVLKQLPNGGFIMLAASTSDSSFDKSENNRDTSHLTYDYWLVRLDSNGNKIWDKTYGGKGNDAPTALLVLPDKGYLLCGNSVSPAGFDKTDSVRGNYDFWIVRTDSNGVKIWDKTIGGTGLDQVQGAAFTTDGYIMLAGITLSGIGGDKTTALIALGQFDFWVVKINLAGTIILDRTLGGSLSDNCYAITATDNGGALLAGISNSPIGFSKTQAAIGSYDYWVVRIDSLCRRLWDKTYGGLQNDYCFNVVSTPDHGFLLGGNSSSTAGFDKTDSARGQSDYWIIKLNANGVKQWDKTFGGTDFEELYSLQLTNDHGFLLGGDSYSPISFDKTENNLGAEQMWMVKTDSVGNKIWDKTFFTAGHDEFGLMLETKDGCYVGTIFTAADTGGYKSSFNYGGGDCWLAKLCYGALGVPDIRETNHFECYPNPVKNSITIRQFSPGTIINIYNISGEKIFQQQINFNETTQIDVSKFPVGLYIISLQDNKSVYSTKFLKE